MRAYNEIKTEADRLGLPLSYRDDLVIHDYNAVKQYGSERPFLWGLRDLGTHLFPVAAEDCWQEGGREGWVGACSRTWPETRWYLWDGQQLLGIPSELAVAIAREYDEAAKVAKNKVLAK